MATAVSNYRQQRLLAQQQLPSFQPSALPTDATPTNLQDDIVINYRQLRIAALEIAATQLPQTNQEGSSNDVKEEEPKVDLKSYRLARIKQIEESSIIGRLFKPGFLKKFQIPELQRHIQYADSQRLFERGNNIRRVLNITDPEFFAVQRKFQETCQQQIIQIEKNENPYLWLQYSLKRAEKQISLQSQELQLFHGTSEANIDAILKNNFDWRMAGRSTGTAYGYGVYFAATANMSARYCKARRKNMILARVLFATYSAGNNKTLIPEPGCDATGGSGVYVKYGDFEYFPEYVITFL